jgi:PPOX class probable F420-dependent enzyme
MTLDERMLGVIAERREGVLATIRADGRPQLSNILYVWEAQAKLARISTTEPRAKARNLRRDPRASLYVSGPHFWTYVVADGEAELIGPSTTPGDEAGRELLQVHGAFYGALDEEQFFQQMVDDQRLVVRLSVSHTYGLVMENPPGG